MNATRIYRADVAAERTAWLRQWQAWPAREVFAHPDYVQLFAQPGECAMCAALETADGGVLFPFVLRPLAKEPWTDSRETAWDLVSPYGYGGAYAWNVDGQAWTFSNEFQSWMKRHAVVSSFVRLSLFPQQQIHMAGDVAIDRPNIVRSLDLGPDDLWRDYEHKVRKNVKRAKQAGLRVEFDPDGRRIEDFLAIYYATLDRREAEEGYYFSRAFFADIIRRLPGQFMFFHALSGEHVVATELVLVSADHLYSFLGGTRAEAFAERPNDLLKHEIILWGHRAGKRAFVLGGGYDRDDGILRYKRSFAPDGSRPFQVARQIVDPQACARLVQRRRDWEQQQGRDWQPKPGYFPAYRAGNDDAPKEVSR